MYEILLNGIDGSNLLGFLAALGTLRVLSEADRSTDIRLGWRDTLGWRPTIWSNKFKSKEELLTRLSEIVCGVDSVSPAWTISKDLNLNKEAYRRILMNAIQSADLHTRTTVGFLSGFGSEFIGSVPKKEIMTDTEFRTMSGAGHQHFLGFMVELATNTTASQIARALMHPWDYSDERPSMRWDPSDYRPHALRSEDPSTDPIRTMRGANRLAIEGLPLFPTMPVGSELRTVTFSDRDGEAEITWPIWVEALELDTVKSLLVSADVHNVVARNLEARGVVQIFRAQRFTEGKYRNFTPSKALL